MELLFDTFDIGGEEVRRRFETARASGLPHWLWPDLPLDSWRSALRSIAETIGAVLRGETGTVLSGDADAIGVACYTSGTGPLLGLWSEQKAISSSPAVASLLALHLAHNRTRVEKMTAAAREVVDALAAEGIEVTVLKGMHTAHAYFDDPGARPFSDIDLHVSKSDEAAAGEVLSSLGFEKGAVCRWSREVEWTLKGMNREPRTLCLVHADDPWSIDLRPSLNRGPYRGGRVSRLDEASDEFGRQRWTGSAGAAVLGQPLLLLYLAAHTGMTLESLTLLRIAELALVIRRDTETGSLFWSEFLDVGRRTGTLGFCYPSLLCSEKIRPATIPVEVLHQCRLAAPATARRIAERLEPALAQRVERCSFGERYMWSDTWWLKGRQFAFELVPPKVTSLTGLYRIYQTRLRRLMYKTVSW